MVPSSLVLLDMFDSWEKYVPVGCRSDFPCVDRRSLVGRLEVEQNMEMLVIKSVCDHRTTALQLGVTFRIALRSSLERAQKLAEYQKDLPEMLSGPVGETSGP